MPPADDTAPPASAPLGKDAAPAFPPAGPGADADTDAWDAFHGRHAQRHVDLWMRLLADKLDNPEADRDRRFGAAEWRASTPHDYLRQAYLINADWLQQAVARWPADPATRRRLAFFTRQLIDALCPANFPATNAEALKRMAETEGRSLQEGVRNLLDDIRRRRISMTDESAFEVGRNLAITPGTVVYENELFQLIQYAPAGERVRERPLLIVPPFINKYYILDLQPENSFVRYALEQGLQVFLISWRNVGPELGGATWDDYLDQVVFRALDITLEIAGTQRLNALGFCVGGTLLASGLALLRARRDRRVASLTLLTTLLDFAEPGDIGVYVQEPFVAQKEAEFAGGGVMRGAELAQAFASLRANELVWNYVVNNYLKGQAPPPFDLLYWNSDSANVPGALFAFYLRRMYLDNALRLPGALLMRGTRVDLRRIDVPTFVLAARDDHIVPWRSAFASARLLSGRIEFVLAASGHIAGVINPAAKKRRSHWTGAFGHRNAEDWMAEARSHAGSWWPRWAAWLRRRSGKTVAAPAAPGSGRYPPIEPAPGRYVRVRHE
ncbi:MAG TPA: class I poly(R)-hydroxyalkanoic acid synthase [Pelomicrobium sp.]|nr:class I poly(R)-hydroxyalkanoic acid synthase [Pelomicrobium sp.]